MKKRDTLDEQQAADQADTIGLTRQTMLGELMKVLTDEIKALPEVWQKLAEEAQAGVIDRARRRIELAVKEAVDIIAADERPVAKAMIESVQFKDGIKVVLTLSATDKARHSIADSTGHFALLVIADPAEYLGGAETIQPDPEQPGLGLDRAA